MSTAQSRHQPELPSNKKFGWLLTCVFAVATAHAYIKLSNTWLAVWLVLLALTAVVTVLAPHVLLPLNRLWFGLGLLLGKIVNPIVLGVIFFLLITPVSVVTRLFGRDALSLRKRKATSYWVERTPAGPAPESFRDPF